MDDLKLVNATQICVIIEGAEFAKDFNYFMTVQLDGQGEKRRTDISARVTNPIFSANTFYLPLPTNRIELNMRLLFAAFVVADRDGNAEQGKGQARLLGESVLELGPLASVLTDVKGAGTRQHLRFVRVHEGKQVTVGRFLVTIRLVPEHAMVPTALDAGEIFHPLPVNDPFAEFLWRVRIDFRAGVDIPFNNISTSGLPSPYLEFGWSAYIQQRPPDNEMVRSLIIPNNRHPIWNHQELFLNPRNVTNLDGFFWLLLKDRVAAESLESMTIPITAMRAFHPVHMEVATSRGGDASEPRCQIYCSLTIEEAITTSFVDHLIDIAIIGVNWDPLPTSTNKIMIAMTTHGYHLTDIPFTEIDLKGETNLSRELLRHKAERHSVFLTPMIPITPSSHDNPYNSQAVFTIPRSYLENQLSFFLIARDESLVGNTRHPLPNTIVAHTEILDDDLQTSLYAKTDKTLYVPMIWSTSSSMYRVLGQCKCTIQIGVFSLDKQEDSSIEKTRIEDRQVEMGKADLSYSLRATQPRNKNEMGGAALSIGSMAGGGGGKERWELLARELQQKQELIHRLMKENDEKSDALKLTGAEIIDLRRQIKLLQSENAILRQRLHEEEEIDVRAVVSKEVEQMNNEELKLKIIKIAQMYRNERTRNEEFEKIIKQAQGEVSEAYKYKLELDKLREKHERDMQKLQKVQSQVDRVKVYRETIKKQEAVISKLEKLLDKTLKDTQQARETVQELEKLRTENFELQRRLKDTALGTQTGNSNVEQARQEVRRLERLVAELREQLKSKRPETREDQSDWEREKVQLEVDLQRAELRVQTMQEEMDRSSAKFAKELAHYKGLLAEKQSIIDTMRMGQDMSMDKY